MEHKAQPQSYTENSIDTQQQELSGVETTESAYDEYQQPQGEDEIAYNGLAQPDNAYAHDEPQQDDAQPYTADDQQEPQQVESAQGYVEEPQEQYDEAPQHDPAAEDFAEDQQAEGAQVYDEQQAYNDAAPQGAEEPSGSFQEYPGGEQ